MASVYTNDLRLEEIGSGEQSGTWGDTTNTNLELIAEGLSFGTEAITTNADTHTSTVADGASDPARSMFIKYTGTLDSACTITIAPNTLSRMHFIENGTSGSQNIIIKQGSDDAADKVTIPAGDTKAVYLDGAGSGAVVRDAFASLNVVDLKVEDDLTVTDDVAIGGLATVGGTLGVTGKITSDAGIDIDNFNIDGTTVALSSGNMTIDAAAGDIILEGHSNGTVQLTKQGTQYGTIFNGSDDLTIQAVVANKDIVFKAKNGSTDTERLRIDSAGTVTIAPPAQYNIPIDMTVDPDGRGPRVKQVGYDTSSNTGSAYKIDVSTGKVQHTSYASGDSAYGSHEFYGEMKFSSGDLTFGTAGKGVVLGATTNVDANTLSDYEEGSFNPTWAAASGTIGPYSSSNQGKYTKVGQMVYVYGYISYGSNSSASGDVFIEGLPFTAIAGIGQSSAYNAGIKVFRTYSWASNAPIEGYMVNSTAKFGLLSYSGTGSIPTQFSHFNTNANTSQAPFFGIYHTAS